MENLRGEGEVGRGKMEDVRGERQANNVPVTTKWGREAVVTIKSNEAPQDAK